MRLCGLFVLALCACLVGAPQAGMAKQPCHKVKPTSAAWASYQRVSQLLKQKRPWRGFRRLSRGFRIIALSYAAQGVGELWRCYPARRAGFRAFLQRSAHLALHRRFSPYRKPLARVRRFGVDGLYLSHLAIVLGTAMRYAKVTKYRALLLRIVRHLARRSLASRTRHIRSYRTSRHRWPADQSATLYALWLADRTLRLRLSQRPIRAWLRYMKRHATTKLGLPFSNVTKSRAWKVPRGCAISWSIPYMRHFAPKEAKRLYRIYKQHYAVQVLGLAGFREWPRGYRGFVDVDTGPIVMGVGTAATAFGIGAARSMGDVALARRLLRSRRTVRWAARQQKGKLRRLAEGALAACITLFTDSVSSSTGLP